MNSWSILLSNALHKDHFTVDHIKNIFRTTTESEGRLVGLHACRKLQK